MPIGLQILFIYATFMQFCLRQVILFKKIMKFSLSQVIRISNVAKIKNIRNVAYWFQQIHLFKRNIYVKYEKCSSIGPYVIG